jgi:hypothetical protein
MNQLNISQLQNLWMRSPDERLASWRDFRIELQSTMVGCVDNIPVSALWENRRSQRDETVAL